ncbi:uncharacterized protein LOC123291247 [Chrysoperla carnea]|uniref:uncharacterized protein LOC123291247 n=1 Tax=Chrysoperla carnea TaxID=189513 RepID=UPI001D0708EC|nr:uncharacterized protein LOC123291247 [Chrysoperla carnea]
MYNICLILLCVIKIVLSIQRSFEQDESTFTECLRTGQAQSVMACAGLTALNKLQSLQSEQSYTLVDGFTLINDINNNEQQHTRGIPILERDPSDFRGIFDAVGTALSQRSMHWDMSTIYPGLGLRLGPSYGASGVLEFVLDPIRETMGSVKETSSTARLLTRQLLVPFLLGFKFNTATLVPILFGILALLAKKAVIISKLALVISSALGLGSLLFGAGGGGPAGFGGYGQQPPFGFGGHNGVHYSDRFSAHPLNVGGSGHFHHHYKGDNINLMKSSQPDPNHHSPLSPSPAYTETIYRGQVNGNDGSDDTDELTLGGRLQDIYTTRGGGLTRVENWTRPNQYQGSNVKTTLLFDDNIIYGQFSPSRNIDEKKSVFKKISECLHNGDSFVCLKEYTVTLLNDAIVNDKTISVSSYFDIVKDQNYHLKEEDKLNDNKLHQLDTIKNQTEKNIVLDELITDKLEQFLESRSLKINFAPVIEGRGKKKDKYGGMMLAGGLAMAGMMAQMAMGKIAFIAGTALLVAKMALLMSSIIGLKKLVGSSGGSEHVVVTAAAPSSDHGHGGYGGGGGWSRSLDAVGLAPSSQNAANMLAYKAYYPIVEKLNDNINYTENETKKKK